MQSFLEFYNQMQESVEYFTVGNIQVKLEQISDETYFMEAMVPPRVVDKDYTQFVDKSPEPGRLPGQVRNRVKNADNNPKYQKWIPGSKPNTMMKFRATYSFNNKTKEYGGAMKTKTSYLTAQNIEEAKHMLYDYLQQYNDSRTNYEIMRNANIAAVNNWEELVKFMQYSMNHEANPKEPNYHLLGKVDYQLIVKFIKEDPGILNTIDSKTSNYIRNIYEKIRSRNPGLPDLAQQTRMRNVKPMVTPRQYDQTG